MGGGGGWGCIAKVCLGGWVCRFLLLQWEYASEGDRIGGRLSVGQGRMEWCLVDRDTLDQRICILPIDPSDNGFSCRPEATVLFEKIGQIDGWSERRGFDPPFSTVTGQSSYETILSVHNFAQSHTTIDQSQQEWVTFFTAVSRNNYLKISPILPNEFQRLLYCCTLVLLYICCMYVQCCLAYVAPTYCKSQVFLRYV